MNLLDIQQATLRARVRTGDASISTRARNGQLQIVSVTYCKGVSRIQTISDWMPLGQVIDALDALQSEEESA